MKFPRYREIERQLGESRKQTAGKQSDFDNDVSLNVEQKKKQRKRKQKKRSNVNREITLWEFIGRR